MAKKKDKTALCRVGFHLTPAQRAAMRAARSIWANRAEDRKNQDGDFLRWLVQCEVNRQGRDWPDYDYSYGGNYAADNNDQEK